MPVETDKNLKSKLSKIEHDLSELRDEEATALAERDQAKEAFANVDGYDRDSDEFKAAQEATARVGEIQDSIADVQAAQVEVLRMLGREVDAPERTNGLPSSNGRGGGEGAWDSSRLFQDHELRATLARASTSKSRFGGIELGQVAPREVLAQGATVTDRQREAAPFGILPQLVRPLTIMDLLPTGTMDGNVLPYTVESGDFDEGVGEVVEGEVKPEAGVTYTDAEAAARTIATWLKIRKQVLADVPALQSVIDGRLRYMVQRRLEGQILNGNGTDPNLRGILNTAGIGNVEHDGTALVADQILTGITEVLLADAFANGVVMNPLDWRDVLKARAEGGDEHYYGGGPFAVTPQVLWGVSLIPSRVIPQGTALVGDFGIGAQVFIREGINVLLSDSDQDDFVRNRVTLLAEMRAALAVFRPAAFVEVELAAPAT